MLTAELHHVRPPRACVEQQGKRQARPTPLRMPVAEAIEGHGGGVGVLEARGTFVLAMVFLAAFVLYYFVNWKYLGSVWGLS